MHFDSVLIPLLLASGVAFVLWKLIGKRVLQTPLDYGRIWLAWTAVFVTLGILPGFFRTYEIDALLAYLIVFLVVGGIAFALGLFYGWATRNRQME